MNRTARMLVGLGLGILCAVAAMFIEWDGWVERFELAAFDWRARWLARSVEGEPLDSPARAIRVILLDQQSLDWAKQENALTWPWPRSVYEPLLDFCGRSGAKVVAFDFFFADHSAFGVEDDGVLADAIERLPACVLALPVSGSNQGTTAWPDGVPLPAWRVAGDSIEAVQFPVATSATFSLTEIAAAADGLGHVRGEKGLDGITRCVQPVYGFDGHMIPLLGLAAHLVTDESATLTTDPQGRLLRIGDLAIPLDRQGEAVLRYRKPQAGPGGRMYPTYSAAAVIQSELAMLEGDSPTIDPGVFKDAYVFIGPSAPGLYDVAPTPMNRAGPGVEVHATFLDNLLTQSFLRSQRGIWVWVATALLGGLGAWWCLAGRSVREVAVAVVIVGVLPSALGVLMYALDAWWPVVTPTAGVMAAMTGGVLINLSTEGRQRRFIRQAFQQYLSADVIERIVRDPKSLQLGGERREVTIFFSDLAGFSTIAETLDAQALAQLLNAYLTEMTDIILEEAGTIDKYVGDAIVAFWNAPSDQPDHAVRACRAAMRCQQRLTEKRAEWEAETGASLAMRIGIHTGEVSVGNFGSTSRFDYTIIGHAANLASRLEGANKAFGTDTMISQATAAQLDGSLPLRVIGRIRVVGLHDPVQVHALVADGGRDDAAGWQRCDEAIRLLETGRMEEARRVFGELGQDTLAKRYAARLDEPGQEQWDGVWNLTAK